MSLHAARRLTHARHIVKRPPNIVDVLPIVLSTTIVTLPESIKLVWAVDLRALQNPPLIQVATCEVLQVAVSETARIDKRHRIVPNVRVPVV